MLYKLIKRVFDFVCAFLGIVGTSPIWLTSIILTELSDPGPLFYFANRVGKDNKRFKMWQEGLMRLHCALTKTVYSGGVRLCEDLRLTNCRS